ncbi:MAG: ATP-binding cassette domain-containing protein [Candidatus Lokiarchaeia archaeon]
MLAIETQNLRKVFGNFPALKGINIEVQEGTCYGLLGPNGAGKTTAIKVILGLLLPTEGEAKVFGYKAGSFQARQKIGYLPERVGYYAHVKAIDFLRYIGILSNMSSADTDARAEELIEWVGLGGWGEAPIGNLSAGMKQRLGLAQAVMGDPELVILDEPTSNLDPIGRSEILERIKEITKEGRTVFVSSHVLPEIEVVSDYVGIIHMGEMIKQGKLKDIKKEELKRGKHDYELIVDKPEAIIPELQKASFVSNVNRSDDRILIKATDMDQLGQKLPKLLVDTKVQLVKFAPLGESLQDIFLQIMGETKNVQKKS